MKQIKINPPAKVIPLNKKKVPGIPRPDIKALVHVDMNRTQDHKAKLDNEKPDSVNITADT
jgi:hypothetical protein